MSKHAIGAKARHSKYGDGEVTGVRQVTKTPDKFDPVKLDGEKWNLVARLAEIERIKARGMDPYNEDVYEVTFPGGRKLECDELAVDKLTERAAE